MLAYSACWGRLSGADSFGKDLKEFMTGSSVVLNAKLLSWLLTFLILAQLHKVM